WLPKKILKAFLISPPEPAILPFSLPKKLPPKKLLALTFPKECFPLPVKKFWKKRFWEKLNSFKATRKHCRLMTTLLTLSPFHLASAILKILKKDFPRFFAY